MSQNNDFDESFRAMLDEAFKPTMFPEHAAERRGMTRERERIIAIIRERQARAVTFIEEDAMRDLADQLEMENM